MIVFPDILDHYSFKRRVFDHFKELRIVMVIWLSRFFLGPLVSGQYATLWCGQFIKNKKSNSPRIRPMCCGIGDWTINSWKESEVADPDSTKRQIKPQLNFTEAWNIGMTNINWTKGQYLSLWVLLTLCWAETIPNLSKLAWWDAS